MNLRSSIVLLSVLYFFALHVCALESRNSFSSIDQQLFSELTLSVPNILHEKPNTRLFLSMVNWIRLLEGKKVLAQFSQEHIPLYPLPSNVTSVINRYVPKSSIWETQYVGYKKFLVSDLIDKVEEEISHGMPLMLYLLRNDGTKRRVQIALIVGYRNNVSAVEDMQFQVFYTTTQKPEIVIESAQTVYHNMNQEEAINVCTCIKYDSSIFENDPDRRDFADHMVEEFYPYSLIHFIEKQTPKLDRLPETDKLDQTPGSQKTFFETVFDYEATLTLIFTGSNFLRNLKARGKNIRNL